MAGLVSGPHKAPALQVGLAVAEPLRWITLAVVAERLHGWRVVEAEPPPGCLEVTEAGLLHTFPVERRLHGVLVVMEAGRLTRATERQRKFIILHFTINLTTSGGTRPRAHHISQILNAVHGMLDPRLLVAHQCWIPGDQTLETPRPQPAPLVPTTQVPPSLSRPMEAQPQHPAAWLLPRAHPLQAPSPHPLLPPGGLIRRLPLVQAAATDAEEDSPTHPGHGRTTMLLDMLLHLLNNLYWLFLIR